MNRLLVCVAGSCTYFLSCARSFTFSLDLYRWFFVRLNVISIFVMIKMVIIVKFMVCAIVVVVVAAIFFTMFVNHSLWIALRSIFLLWKPIYLLRVVCFCITRRCNFMCPPNANASPSVFVYFVSPLVTFDFGTHVQYSDQFYSKKWINTEQPERQ